MPRVPLLYPALMALAAFAIMSPAHAATVIACNDFNGSSFTASPQNPCPVQSVTLSTAPAVTGFGTLSATAASALLSTAVVGPNSAVWPATTAQVWVNNSAASAGLVYVCPLGGTCSATVGIPIGIGAAYGFYKPSTAMTVFAVTTATVVGQW